MSRIFDGKPIGDFREEQRKAALEKFGARKRLEAEQQEQIRREAEATLKPLHEEMRDKAANLTDTMQQLQPGDPRATAVIRSCFLGLLEIMSYVLELETQDGN